MIHRQAFGTALREARIKKRLSQEELGFDSGLNRGYISLVELGRKSPTLDTMQKLAAALETKVSTLALRMDAILQKHNDESTG